MSQKIVELFRPQVRPPARPPLPVLYLGRGYLMEDVSTSVLPPVHGLIGGYQVSMDEGLTLPVTIDGGRASGFFWDTDATLPAGARRVDDDDVQTLDSQVLRGNGVQVTGSGLHGPALVECGGEAVLTLSPWFELEFHTDAYAATLGVIHLVQAQRFITLDDGTRIELLDTHGQEGPVLYLCDRDDRQPVKPVAARQGAGEVQAYAYGLEVTQRIPAEAGGRAVESVTVLEQYSSYFIQRELDQPPDACIWTPACAPMAWGWSIRVGRRVDGPWGIVRRKLMLPIAGHDGLELPVWSGNTLICSR